jgi:hypothetical protein
MRAGGRGGVGWGATDGRRAGGRFAAAAAGLRHAGRMAGGRRQAGIEAEIVYNRFLIVSRDS